MAALVKIGWCSSRGVAVGSQIAVEMVKYTAKG